MSIIWTFLFAYDCFKFNSQKLILFNFYKGYITNKNQNYIISKILSVILKKKSNNKQHNIKYTYKKINEKKYLKLYNNIPPSSVSSLF